MLTIVLDTTRPVISGELINREDGRFEVSWSIEDANLSLQTLRVEHRYQGEEAWHPLPVTPMKRAVHIVSEKRKVAEVRLRVKDKAGNEGETILKP